MMRNCPLKQHEILRISRRGEDAAVAVACASPPLIVPAPPVPVPMQQKTWAQFASSCTLLHFSLPLMIAVTWRQVKLKISIRSMFMATPGSANVNSFIDGENDWKQCGKAGRVCWAGFEVSPASWISKDVSKPTGRALGEKEARWKRVSSLFAQSCDLLYRDKLRLWQRGFRRPLWIVQGLLCWNNRSMK